MSLGVAAGAAVAPGVIGAALEIAFVGGLATGFDIATLGAATAAGLDAGGAVPAGALPAAVLGGGAAAGGTLLAAGTLVVTGTLDVMVTAGPLTFALGLGALPVTFTAGAVGCCTVLVSSAAAAGALSVGAAAVCSVDVATGEAVIV